MMMLNERAMKAMLNDINQVDYDIPGEGKLLDTLDKLSADAAVLTKDGIKSKKKSPLRGRDFNLATKLDFKSIKKLDLKSILNIARIAEQLDTASSV